MILACCPDNFSKDLAKHGDSILEEAKAALTCAGLSEEQVTALAKLTEVPPVPKKKKKKAPKKKAPAKKAKGGPKAAKRKAEVSSSSSSSDSSDSPSSASSSAYRRELEKPWVRQKKFLNTETQTNAQASLHV